VTTQPGATPDPGPSVAGPSAAGPSVAGASTGRTLAVYSLLRLGLFVGGVIILLPFVRGRNGLYLAMIISAIVSGIASYFLLRSQRAPLAAALDRRLTSSRSASASKTASEDAADDALRSQLED
jgi:hypothetical protein